MHAKSLATVSTFAVLLGGASAIPAIASSAPAVKKVAVQAAPDYGKNTFAVYFKTDGTIGRKANGKSVDASAGFGKATEASVGTVNAAKHCYVSYLKSPSVHAGAKHEVHIQISGHETTRTVAVLRAKAAKSIGC